MAVITTRPFRAPPHTISDAGLIGDGYVSMPGEVYGRLRASSPSMSCGAYISLFGDTVPPLRDDPHQVSQTVVL